MRYYLDTNMLVFILLNPKSDDISREAVDIIFDFPISFMQVLWQLMN
ncbi:hypothetical protein Barb6XT_02132 [Bacteroidales bacterium Barb6XT]|nr:hypothetical protein Barb6XT_02132 [Bacteroidales bacterium Barb6XT]